MKIRKIFGEAKCKVEVLLVYIWRSQFGGMALLGKDKTEIWWISIGAIEDILQRYGGDV